MTHSCNRAKPWCWRCPKCAYVWLGYMAYLPREVVDPLLVEQPLALPENQLAYRQMLGLEAHTPFECIGQIDEARLAFELCRRKGYTGAAMDTFTREVEIGDLDRIIAGYLSVDEDVPSIPEPMRAALVAQMKSAAGRATAYVRATIARR